MKCVFIILSFLSSFPIFSQPIKVYSQKLEYGISYYGYKDTILNKRITKPIFIVANPFKDNVAIVCYERKYGIIGTNGKYILQPEYDEITDFVEGFSIVRKDLKSAFINKEGKFLTDFEFDLALPFQNGIAKVRKDFYFNYLEKLGNYLLPQGKYNYVGDFICDRAIVSKANLYGIIDIKGNEILKPSLTDLKPCSNGFFVYKSENIYGYIDTVGNFVIPAKYSYAYPFYKHFAIVKIDELYGIINKKGEYLVEPSFDMIYDIHENFCMFRKNGKSGYIDSLGKTLCGPIYERGANFLHGFAKVKKDSLYGYLNTNGKLVCDYIFKDATSFCNKNTSALVSEDGKFYYLIDTLFNQVSSTTNTSFLFVDSPPLVFYNGRHISLSDFCNERIYDSHEFKYYNLDSIDGEIKFNIVIDEKGKIINHNRKTEKGSAFIEDYYKYISSYSPDNNIPAFKDGFPVKVNCELTISTYKVKLPDKGFRVKYKVEINNIHIVI